MQRIWKRNLGRDDRCCADNGKEVQLTTQTNFTHRPLALHNHLIIYFKQARFPFLDEDVIRTLLDIPLWEIANLDQPSGTGDKKILREVSAISSKFLYHLLCINQALSCFCHVS